MLILSNRQILLLMMLCYIIYACTKVEYVMKDFIGVYYYEHMYKEYNILDYLILNSDSTYIHVYIYNNDTIRHIGKWYFSGADQYEDFHFYDWEWFNKEHCFPEECWETYSPFDYSPYSIRFHPDANEVLYRVDSVEAASIGIKEDSIVWKIE